MEEKEGGGKGLKQTEGKKEGKMTKWQENSTALKSEEVPVGETWEKQSERMRGTR